MRTRKLLKEITKTSESYFMKGRSKEGLTYGSVNKDVKKWQLAVDFICNGEVNVGICAI